MTVVDRVDGNTVTDVVAGDVEEGQTIRTDGYSSYNAVKQAGYKHQKEVLKGRKAHEVLKWAHILVSNAKAFILGTFHGVDRKHLQFYLDEFCYRLNRRWTEGLLFDRLVTACVNSSSIKFSELTQ
jgi:transposase-like protein